MRVESKVAFHKRIKVMKTKPTIIALCLGVVLQASALAQLPPPAAPKPPVGVPKDAKLFNGKWYKVIFEKVSWSSARDKCRTAGGQLVVIPDEPTWTFVKTLSPAFLWLGATDEKVEGVWEWVDGSPVSFAAWGNNQPDNHIEKSYLYIRGKELWHDSVSNDKGVAGYICEWKAK